MSQFSVVTAAVSDASARVAGISSGIDAVHGRIGACSGAAAGTPLDGALEGLLGGWSGTLPQFGACSDHLSRAIGGAAKSYAGTDASVAEAAGGTNPAEG